MRDAWLYKFSMTRFDSEEGQFVERYFKLAAGPGVDPGSRGTYLRSDSGLGSGSGVGRFGAP